MRDCCRCNRGGRCRNCACVKNGDQCTGCLPGRLGKCENGASDTYDADNSHHDADNSYHSVPTTTINETVYQPHVDVDVDALAMTPLASLRTVEGDDFTDEVMTNEDEPIRPVEEPPTPMTDPLNPEPICLSEGEQTSISREGDNTLHHTLMTPPTPTPIDDLPPFEPGAPQNYRWGVLIVNSLQAPSIDAIKRSCTGNETFLKFHPEKVVNHLSKNWQGSSMLMLTNLH